MRGLQRSSAPLEHRAAAGGEPASGLRDRGLRDRVRRPLGRAAGRLVEAATSTPARKVGASIAAAGLLIPSATVAARWDGDPRPAPRPDAQSGQVLDGQVFSQVEALTRQMEATWERSITHTLGEATVRLPVPRAELQKLSPEAQRAHALVRALLSAEQRPGEAQAAWEALATLAAAAGVPAESPLTVDGATLEALARHLRDSGMPLTTSGTGEFKAQRALKGAPARIDLATARAYATSLRGPEVVVQAPLELPPQLAGARSVVRAAGPEATAQTLAELGIQVRPRGNAQRQADVLGHVVVDRAALAALARSAAARGVSLTPDGIAALRQARGLGEGPRVDTATARTILTLLSPVGPRPEGEAARAEWYQRIVEREGGTWRDGGQRMNVVGLRGFDVDRGRHDNAFGAWNDTMAFVWRDAEGRPKVREFRATTDPGMRAHADAPDVTGDGRGDVAHLRPGQYEYRVGPHKGLPGAGNPTVNVPVDRDTNQDGVISGAERRASIERGDVGWGINIHWGPGGDPSEIGPYSLGCQVVTLSHAEFRREVTPLLGMNDTILYTLVDARTLG